MVVPLTLSLLGSTPKAAKNQHIHPSMWHLPMPIITLVPGPGDVVRQDPVLVTEQQEPLASEEINDFSDSSAGCDPRPIIDWQAYEGQVLPTDRRKDLTNGPPFTTEPLLLEALEFGWRQDMMDIALACFLAQKSRFAQTGHLTAFSEDALDRPPGFAYGAITAGDRAFPCQSRSGRDLSRLHALSTKAAFSWDALVPCPYSQKLVDTTSGLETKSGWYAGRYEHAAETNRVLSLNTNAVILEALHYIAYGPLFPTNENARA